jgi:hypothetical protein
MPSLQIVSGIFNAVAALFSDMGINTSWFSRPYGRGVPGLSEYRSPFPENPSKKNEER